MGPRELLGETVDVVEVPIGLVLVLLFQLGVVEVIIVVTTGDGCLGAGAADRGLGGGRGRANRVVQTRASCSQIRNYSKHKPYRD